MTNGRDPSQPGVSIDRMFGRIEEGFDNLKEGQKQVDEKISTLHGRVADLVSKDDCKDHRDVLCKKFDAKLEGQEIEDVGVSLIQPTLLERLGKKAGAIAAIVALLGMLGGALLVLARFIGSVELALKTDRAAQKRATKKMLQELRRPKAPVIVHQPIPVYPDAGQRRRYMRRTAGRRSGRRGP